MSAPVSIENILAGYAARKALDYVFSQLSRHVLAPLKLRFPRNVAGQCEQALLRRGQELARWSNYMEYTPNGQPIELSKLYIALDLFLEPIEITEIARNKRTTLKRLLGKLDGHLILLGRPGIGKTTTLKAICHDYIRGESLLEGYFPIPLVIRLREINNRKSLYSNILELLDVQILRPRQIAEEDEEARSHAKKEGKSQSKADDYAISRDIAIRILNELHLLIILDGFDEIENTTVIAQGREAPAKEHFVREFEHLCLNLETSLVILTSRTADFPFFVTRAHKFELSPLTAKQIKTYIRKFFRDKEEQRRAQEAILEQKLLGAEYIPLTLCYLCIVFDKYKRLFNSRREIYNRLLDLLLEEWDLNRQVQRPSTFASFDVYDKKAFLRNLAYDLACSHDRSYYSEDEVRQAYLGIVERYPNLAPKEFRRVMREIETHTGLLVRAGLGYEFSHKTMQEYLFSLYMFEFPEIPKDKELLWRFPNELALTVSFNENPTRYFSFLVMERFDADFFSDTFFFPFSDRLIVEGVRFGVHPYLALSMLIIYQGVRGGELAFPQQMLSQFYRFLNIDNKIEKSMDMLGHSYIIAREMPEKNAVALKRVEPVDKKLAFSEPEWLLAPYEYYEFFCKSSN